MTRKNKKARSGDEPIGSLREIADFLPPPSDLLPKDDVIKITLTIDNDTVDFFKEVAKESGTKYQRMMREVLKGYAKRYA